MFSETKHKDLIYVDDWEICFYWSLSTSDTATLQNRFFFFELLLFFYNKGHENVREMKIKEFQICIDDRVKHLMTF